MKILCKLGIHSWELIGFIGLSLSNSIKRCRRCGIGHMGLMFGEAYCRYTKEQMDDSYQSEKGGKQ